jgi:formylglycine-generating enzyme required for sulfatase activity
LIESLEAFADEKTGLCSAGTNPKHGWGIERRLELARSLEERTLNGSDAARRWRDAIRSIADRGECPLYDGLEITPQLGLLPIGRNASSGLWEFAHVASGEPAVFGPAGEAEPTEEFGLVFVLIPGGSFWMGSQNADPDAENYDPSSVNTESPVHEVALDAYFLSKFEMSQAQWQRFMGENPSCYDLETNQGGNPTTLMHPVEQVSWSRATLVMARLDLRLPTEAQWERGARAGTRTPWWTGTEPESLAGAGNIADSFADRNNAPRTWKFATWLDDGYLAHAPIGTYRANPYGLHDVIGNVLEICGDGYGSYLLPVNPGDGARLGTDMRTRPLRGAGFHIGVIRARSTNRYDVTPDYSDFGFGVRPARALMP